MGSEKQPRSEFEFEIGWEWWAIHSGPLMTSTLSAGGYRRIDVGVIRSVNWKRSLPECPKLLGLSPTFGCLEECDAITLLWDVELSTLKGLALYNCGDRLNILGYQPGTFAVPESVLLDDDESVC